MNFSRYDVITFEDGEKVVVLESLMYENKEYLYVNEVLPDETDVTDKYKVLEPNYNNGTFEKVIDIEILKILIPMFKEKLEQYA